MHSDTTSDIEIGGEGDMQPRPTRNVQRGERDATATASTPPRSETRLSAAQLAAAQKVLQHIRPAPPVAASQRFLGADGAAGAA